MSGRTDLISATVSAADDDRPAPWASVLSMPNVASAGRPSSATTPRTYGLSVTASPAPGVTVMPCSIANGSARPPL